MTEQAPLPVEAGPVPLRAEDYFLRGETGALNDYKRTELIDRVIGTKGPSQ